MADSTHPQNSDLSMPELDSVREIIWGDEPARLQAELDSANVEIERLRNELAVLSEKVNELTSVKANEQTVIPNVQDAFVGLTNKAVSTKAHAMAEAVGPMLADATRVQIREAEGKMADALRPIILPAAQMAVRDALRDFQKQIDAQLSRGTSTLNEITYRLRGMTPTQVTMRDSLPFTVTDAFVIQNGSGLLMAHYGRDSHKTDNDLIGAMLTAIRDFANDAFSDGSDDRQELSEVQYGSSQIVIKGGDSAYSAVVVDGTLPSGFTSDLQLFISNLHTLFAHEWNLYDGDPDTITDLESSLEKFVLSYSESAEETKKESSSFMIGLGCAVFATIVVLGFTAIFIWRLLPIAFPNLFN